MQNINSVPETNHEALSAQLQDDIYQAAFLLRQTLISLERWERAGGKLPPFSKQEIQQAMTALDMTHLIPFTDLPDTADSDPCANHDKPGWYVNNQGMRRFRVPSHPQADANHCPNCNGYIPDEENNQGGEQS